MEGNQNFQEPDVINIKDFLLDMMNKENTILKMLEKSKTYFSLVHFYFIRKL
jgi:hypothetical protein